MPNSSSTPFLAPLLPHPLTRTLWGLGFFFFFAARPRGVDPAGGLFCLATPTFGVPGLDMSYTPKKGMNAQSLSRP